MKPTLIAMVGLPRSGKSTICEDLRIKLGAPIVRRDAIRLALHGQRYAPAAEPMVKAMSLYMIRSLFQAGHPIVICDETNFSRAARISIQDSSWDTVFYHVATDADTCIQRAFLTNQADLIPIIRDMNKRWEPLFAHDAKFIQLTEDGTIVSQASTE